MVSKHLSFTVCSAWNAIRLTSPKVTWSSFIWFKGGIPKQSFICWLVLLDKLPTKLRLSRYMTIDVSCEFCGAPESREHMFFSCPIISQVWMRIFVTIGKSGPPSLGKFPSLGPTCIKKKHCSKSSNEAGHYCMHLQCLA